MDRKLRLGLAGAAALGILALGTAGAPAAPGDIHEVTGERVNLRSGPSDGSSIRSTVERGAELLELRSEGNWIGVRVLQTGQEGWVFGDLVDRVSQSGLLGGEEAPADAAARADAGFTRLSPEFDGLMARIDQQVGYRLAEQVEQGADGQLRVRPTREWLLNSGRDAKLMTSVALYQMWKNYNDGRPVSLAMLDERGQDLISIADGAGGPDLSVAELFGAQTADTD